MRCNQQRVRFRHMVFDKWCNNATLLHQYSLQVTSKTRADVDVVKMQPHNGESYVSDISAILGKQHVYIWESTSCIAR